MFWVATARSSITGKTIRDVVGSMLPQACVDGQFGHAEAPRLIQQLADNHSPCASERTSGQLPPVQATRPPMHVRRAAPTC